MICCLSAVTKITEVKAFPLSYPHLGQAVSQPGQNAQHRLGHLDCHERHQYLDFFDQSSIAYVVTDNRGNFRVPVSGKFHIEIRHDGYLSVRSSTVSLSGAPDDVYQIEVALLPGNPDLICAEATILRIGNRVSAADIRAFHPSAPDRTVATGKGVYNVLRAKQSP